MRSPLVEAECTLVKRIDFCSLCRIKRCRRKRQGCVTAGISEDLHFVINPAIAPACRVCQSKIAMHKGIFRSTNTVEKGQAAMLRRQRISKLHKFATRILRRVGLCNSVMQMNLNLSPTGMAVFRELLYQGTVVLFGWIKISVNEWIAVVVSPCIRQPRIFPAPEVKATFLFVVGGARHPILRHNRRLEMIRHRDHQMKPTARHAPCKPLPEITG